MAISFLTRALKFPPVHHAAPDGLLAIGGDLSAERLKLAYRSGIFPWYEGKEILWWSPDPRFVLFPNELIVSKSMRTLLKKAPWQFAINRDFASVIRACKEVKREDQHGTWITDEMEAAYNQLHHEGIAMSAETWENGKLIGGLYGVQIGKVFCGESMFAHKSNASKYAFIHCVQHLMENGIALIDCQVYSDHLSSLGARMIPRSTFLSYLNM